MRKNRNKRSSAMRFLSLLLLIAALPAWAETEDENQADAIAEFYTQDTQDHKESDGNDSISMTEKVSKSINDLKKIPYNQYGPYGKLEKVSASKKISMDNDFKLPHFDINRYIILFVVILVVIFFFIILIINIFCMSSSKRKKKKDITNEDDIHNRNFNTELQMMIKEGNYKEAIKIVYLETLYKLNEKHLIKWELAKTPAEYYYEIKNKNIKTDFLQMTSIFLSVRYGNKEADKDMFLQVTGQRDRILKINSQLTIRH
ncbi:MAG: hypothetical protein WCQ55_04660 [Paludibacteraceae bacterium]|nr:hypothetical protein [Prevotellaceae bacterium]